MAGGCGRFINGTAAMVVAEGIAQRLGVLAVEAGFDLAGIAPVPPPEDAAQAEEAERFRAWVESGCAGEMGYLKRRDEAGRLLRSSPRVVFPWVRSVVVCAANYNSAAPRSVDPAPEGAGWIARYAWSGRQEPGSGELGATDYHAVLLPRLRRLEQALQQSLGPFESRCYVDTGPVVERRYARDAGIGWIGKNTCILNQKMGSWLFLGVILTGLELDAKPSLPAADRCGSCTRCIDACPTGALVEPYRMDASLCISYLTIEKRGAISEPLRRPMGRQVFGCDICQDVCPWNRRAPVSGDREMAARPELVNPALDWLASLDADGFRRFFRHSPVERAKLAGLLRNVAIAMGNSGDVQYLARLHKWAGGQDAVLAEAAQWAIDQLGHATGGADQPVSGPISRGLGVASASQSVAGPSSQNSQSAKLSRRPD